MVGLGGLEPPTSPLSGARSSHLSYRPQHRSGTAHNHLIVRWFSVFRNCAEILVWYRTQFLRPAYCVRYPISPFGRSWKLHSPGSATMHSLTKCYFLPHFQPTHTTTISI